MVAVIECPDSVDSLYKLSRRELILRGMCSPENGLDNTTIHYCVQTSRGSQGAQNAFPCCYYVHQIIIKSVWVSLKTLIKSWSNVVVMHNSHIEMIY